MRGKLRLTQTKLLNTIWVTVLKMLSQVSCITCKVATTWCWCITYLAEGDVRILLRLPEKIPNKRPLLALSRRAI